MPVKQRRRGQTQERPSTRKVITRPRIVRATLAQWAVRRQAEPPQPA